MNGIWTSAAGIGTLLMFVLAVLSGSPCRSGVANAALTAGCAPLEAAQGGTSGPGVKEFTVIAERWKFTPDRIEVNQGDTVRITVRSADSTHGLEIKKLDLDLLARKGGKPETAEFVADKAGTFEITCSEYCGRGHEKMKGVLVVHPRLLI